MKKRIISVVLCLTLVGVLSIIGVNNKEVDKDLAVENVINEKSEKKDEISIEIKLEEENTLVEAEEQEDAPLINFWGYTGYLDECNSSNAKEFQNCDYDEDGLNDRVFRWSVIDQGDGNDTMYRIEFGNGEELVLDRAVPDSGFPYILAADFSQKDKNEIVFGCTYWTSTGPMAFGELAIFEKAEDGYRRVDLPMQLSDSAYTMTLDFRYKKVEEQIIQVSCSGTDFSENIEIEDDLWEVQGYKNYFVDETYNSCVWNTEIVQDADGVPKLKCYFGLFDKWTPYEVSLLLRYQNGEFVYDGMELITLN